VQELFKSALDRIKADEALVSRTEARLRQELAPGRVPNNFMKGRIYQMRKFAIAACLAVLLIGGGFVYATPTSYICVDINPSIEVGINAFDKVISVEALNEDGQAVLDELGRIKGMKLDAAVELIVDEAIDQGYIEESDASFVQLTAVTDDEDKASRLLKDAEEGTRAALDENEAQAEVGQAAISQARAAEAKAYGISPGKLNLLQKLWVAQGNEIPADADREELEEIFAEMLEMENDDTDGVYAEGSVKDIMKAIKAERGKGNPNLQTSDDDADDDDDDDVTPGQGKATAPGQLKKNNGEVQDQNQILLPNGKVKKNGPAGLGDDTDDDEEEEDDDED